MDFFRGFTGYPTFLGLFDPGWWDRMLDSTTSGHFSPEATILTVGIFGLAALAILAGLLIQIRSRQPAPTVATWIVKPGEIRALLDTAMTQRSKIRVSFVRDDPGSRSTDATILSASPARGIELEMTSLIRANQSWLGKLVACDFRLRLDPRKDYYRFYNFVAAIKDIRKAGDSFIHMTVAWPERLELEQKRGFLRVEPPRAFVLELGLWPEDCVNQNQGTPADPATWGTSLVQTGSHGEKSQLIEVRNISGGGLRLDVHSSLINVHDDMFEPGDRFLMHLVLAEPEAEQPVELYLALRLQNVYGDPDALGQKAFGMRILSFGVPAPPPAASTLHWKTATAGVPALDDWAFRRHLTFYRTRGE